MVNVFIAVTHLLGVGHLSRAAAIGRALVGAGHAVTLATGGRPEPLLRADGLTVVQLPPVHCVGTDFRTLLDSSGRPATDALLEKRQHMLVEAFAQSGADAVMTELFPFGRRQLAAEYLALLKAAHDRRPRPAVLASIRDILNPPSKTDRADEALERLGAFYDAVLVHGDPAVAPLGLSWPPQPALDRRVVYTGYIAEARPKAPARGDGRGEVIVTGGGGAAGLPLYRLALEAARREPQGPRWRVLVGHGVPEGEFNALMTLAPDNVLVERARPDFAELLSRAAVVVAQAGYNTVVDLAQARARAVLVPFDEAGEREQTLRAAVFSKLGIAATLGSEGLSVQGLAAAVRARLDSPKPIAAAIDLDGLTETVAAIEAAVEWTSEREAAQRRLDAALDHAARSKVTIPVWWRDDDAIAATPALERLLALRGRIDAPLGLAVIPAHAEDSLARRLDGSVGVAVLQHGFAHANQAPPGVKKIELGECPMPLIVGELELGWERLTRMFGRLVKPVLVPPWNRIDPKIVPILPGLGFRGLSTYAARPFESPAPGLFQVNTHWDPVSWRGGGGLANPAALLSHMASLIEDRTEAVLAGEGTGIEPLGLLTHHLVHDSWTWRFVEDVLLQLRASGVVRFVDPWARL